MNPSVQPTDSLYRIKELSDIFADACVRDVQGDLMFLSLYGRDTAVQQLLAAFHLPVTQGGLRRIHLVDPSGSQHAVDIGASDRLEKTTGRFPRANLFGNLTHAWIFDPVLANPDMVNRTAWILTEGDRINDLEARTWEAYRGLSPVPLLDHWRKPVMKRTGPMCITSLADSLYPPLGRVAASRVSLGDDFVPAISKMVREGSLALEVPDAALATMGAAQ